MEDKKITIIIPTIQKVNENLQKLIRTLEQDKSVEEIIVINNSAKDLPIKIMHGQIISMGKNVYVNKAWNIGVKLAKSDYIGLLNDDIILPEGFCSGVLKKMTSEVGIIGMSSASIEDIVAGELTEKINVSDLVITPTKYREYGYGIAMFLPKSSYFEIPEQLKIFYGDDWLLLKNRQCGRKNYVINGQKIQHLGSVSVGNKEFDKICKEDKKQYKKLSKTFFKRLFNLEELQTSYKLTLFGLSFVMYKKEVRA